MRQKRAKAYRKLLHSYSRHFGFRTPYQILLDADFLQTAHASKIDVATALRRTMQDDVKPMITQCCMAALYKLGREGQAVVDVAKEFERRKCGHFGDKTKESGECIRSLVNIEGENKHRYCVATQSYDLRGELRGIAGVPLMFINRAVLILEPESDATAQFKLREERQKLGLSTYEKELLAGKKRKREGEEDNVVGGEALDEIERAREDKEKKRLKKLGPKAPNPLSVKKKKKETGTGPKDAKNKREGVAEESAEAQEAGEIKSGKRRRRRRGNKTGGEDDHVNGSGGEGGDESDF
ncbi:hypothetical protein YB2330_004933 [Saitoella coloradoensis]